MGIFLILLSIAIVILLVFKGVPVFYSAFIASLFCLLTAALFTGAGVDVGVGKYSVTEHDGYSQYFLCAGLRRLLHQ